MSTKENINRMAEAFCRWPLPRTVKPDLCSMDQDYPHRTGTNLLTLTEAKAMVEFILKGGHPPPDGPGEIPTPDGFIKDAKKWLESLGPLSDGEVCGKLADLLSENYHAKHELSAKQAELESLKTEMERIRNQSLS